MFQHQIKHLAYEPNMQADGLTFLNEEESSHLVRVLRMRVGGRMHTTDGAGNLFETEIVELTKREAILRTLAIQKFDANPCPEVHLAVAPLKQMDRFEWMLEKAVEIGVTGITPVLTKRTERTALKLERLQKIMVGAMKQSQRFWLPSLAPPIPFDQYLKNSNSLNHVKLMGWCAEEQNSSLQLVQPQEKAVQILIGPEGDFTPEEAAKAKSAGFQSVSLGNHRLRTETAAIVALALLQPKR